MNSREERFFDGHSSRTSRGVSMNRISDSCATSQRSIKARSVVGRFRLPLLIALCGLVIGTTARGVTATQKRKPSAKSQAAALLRLNQPVTGKLAAGETRAFRLNLKAGQYLHIEIEQRGIDLAATLIAPDGKQVGEADRAKGKQ